MKEKLKELRKTHNYTQKEIADILKISKTGYASWEQGLSEPNTAYLSKLANLFGCTVDYLIDRENEDGIVYIMGNQLSQNENELIDKLRQLDDTRKEIAYRYIEFLLSEQKQER